MTYQSTYWNGDGKFQEQYDYFYEKLVPSSGDCSTAQGELIRRISKVYYRRYNDGDLYDDAYFPISYEALSKIGPIDKDFVCSVDRALSLDYNEGPFKDSTLEIQVNRIMTYVMLNNPDKKYNQDYIRLSGIGYFQSSYNYFYNYYKVGEVISEKPIGLFSNFIRLVTKIYYRNYAYGDTYEGLIELGGDCWKLSSSLSSDSIIRHSPFIMSEHISKLEGILNREKDYMEFINQSMKYIVLVHSTEDKIWNPATNRLVSINGHTGKLALEKLGCKITYKLV